MDTAQNIEQLRKVHLAAAKAADEVGQYLVGILKDQVSWVLRSTILLLDKVPTTEAERDLIRFEAVDACAAQAKAVALDLAKRLKPNQVSEFRDRAIAATQDAVRKIIIKVFPLPGDVSPQKGLPTNIPQEVMQPPRPFVPPTLSRVGALQPMSIHQPPTLPVPAGLPPRLTEPEIEAIVNMGILRVERVGAGGFGQTYKVNYGGKTYLRKDIEFNGDKFTKWSFDTEIKYLELVC
jgi:hypothetical protein